MKRTLIGAALTVLLSASFSAQATLVPVNPPPPNQPIGSTISAITTALAAAVTTYNNNNNPDLPTPVGAVDLNPYLYSNANGTGVNTLGKVDTSGLGNGGSGPTGSVQLDVTGEKYLALTWDGPNGTTEFWYVGDDTGVQTFTDPFGTQYGLSHYLFTTDRDQGTAVPEPSTYIAGALLLLPFGASIVRRLRNTQTV